MAANLTNMGSKLISSWLMSHWHEEGKEPQQWRASRAQQSAAAHRCSRSRASCGTSSGANSRWSMVCCRQERRAMLSSTCATCDVKHRLRDTRIRLRNINCVKSLEQNTSAGANVDVYSTRGLMSQTAHNERRHQWLPPPPSLQHEPASDTHNMHMPGLFISPSLHLAGRLLAARERNEDLVHHACQVVHGHPADCILQNIKQRDVQPQR